MTDLPVLRTLDEAATDLRVSRRTVERLLRQGRLRAIRVPGHRLITTKELAAYIASRRAA